MAGIELASVLLFIVAVVVLVASNAFTAYSANKRIKQDHDEYIKQLDKYYDLKERYDALLNVPGVHDALMAECFDYNDNRRKLTKEIEAVTAENLELSKQEDAIRSKIRANAAKIGAAETAKRSLDGRRKYVPDTLTNSSGGNP
jgi:L-rhamnose isomerase